MNSNVYLQPLMVISTRIKIIKLVLKFKALVTYYFGASINTILFCWFVILGKPENKHHPITFSL